MNDSMMYMYILSRLRKNIFWLFIAVISFLLLSCAATPEKSATVPVSDQTKAGIVDVGDDVTSDFNKAIELLRQGNDAQAAAVLKSVIEREQRLPAPYVNLAIAQNRLGETEAAEQNLIKALKIDITHPVANNELGLLYRKAGKFKAARTAYENAINKHPEYLPARKNLGVLCDLYIHDFNCALEQYEDYLEQKPDDKTVAIWVADVKRRLGQ